MASAHVELIVEDDDDSRRRRRNIKALVVVAGLIALSFAAPESNDGPALRLTPGVADFGSHDVGSASTAEVTLRNATKEPFVVAGIMAEGSATQDDFRIDATRCGRIDAGANCTATVSFTPHAAGPQSAKFRIVDGSNAASETIVAQGVGTEKVQSSPPPVPQPVAMPKPEPSGRPAFSPAAGLKPSLPTTKPTPKPQPPQITETTATEAPPEITQTTVTTETTETAETTATEAPPTTTTTAPERNHAKDTWKKIGRVAAGIAIGALIAHNNSHHDQAASTDRRIDVSPRTLSTGGRANIVTVTNVGKDEVTINSVTFGGQGASLFGQQNDCRTLAAGQKCHIWVSMKEQSNVGATLMIESNAGRATVDLIGQQPPQRQQYYDRKP
jgi:hypothetical protein